MLIDHDPRSAHMGAVMLSLLHLLQVLEPVVRPVTVTVMDMVAGEQFDSRIVEHLAVLERVPRRVSSRMPRAPYPDIAARHE